MSNDDKNVLAQQYQKKTDKQHILDNPDTYIGSVELIDQESYIYEGATNSTSGKVISKEITFIPGLYKLFDEGIVNCRDHVIRMDSKIRETIHDNAKTTYPVTHIQVGISDDNVISMQNDGNGIDVVKHPEYDIWIPEMIFGHLRTSTNYDKSQKKIVGGKNGFGFKLVLIWSSEGTIETVDHVRKLKYVQHFKQNLDIIEPPIITKCSAKPYTKISFRPDYKRFGLTNELSQDMKALLYKRVYDIAAITKKTLKVSLNGDVLHVKSFPQYVDMYIGTKTETERVVEETNDRWTIIAALSKTSEFTQVSFVNGIHTSKGGKHVDYILNQITKKMIGYIEKKKKVTVNANAIKEQLFLFVRCDIENPAFDSQTKDYMNTPSSKFGSTCIVSDKFIDKLAKMGVMESACAIHEVKESKASKKSDGSKTKSIRGIPKLVDANWAGTAKSSQCTIILCEGDSAKAGIVSGLSSEDRNTIGVYPMKGKMLNVRGELLKKIVDNKEIIEMKKILGLESNKEYTVEQVKKSLRYGKILFMTDQDLDGSHIKGLGINMFQCLWNKIARIPNFIGFMNTPILKAKKGTRTLLFYNEGEYEEWKSHNSTQGWKIKYYKGLGTSTGAEFKEYFKHKKIVHFNHTGSHCDNAVDMVFNKKRADDRKDWLGKYERKSFLDTNNDEVTYTDFIHKEMIHYSKYDCERSIPNLMDGLKLSLRKILFSGFKKNLTQEIKVAQFSGYVSEHSGYHHGEASLNSAIVGLAQDYVGSNNINLFMPNGQFGTRLQGGKDSASERYIFTQLNKITRHVFHPADDQVLEYLDDDGLPVEPKYYAPIIPMILVNGSKGIGTGFSTEIQPYNPKDLIKYIKNKLNDVPNTHSMKPFFKGFNGSIVQITETKYLVCGKYTMLSYDKIRISELPIGYWTDDFKVHLESLASNVDKNGKKVNPIIKEIDDMSKTTNVDIVVTFHGDHLKRLESNTCDNGCNGLEKVLKLYTTISTSNMHLFDAEDRLKKYDNVTAIIDDYYKVRFALYQTRKQKLIESKTYECDLLENKSRYIQEILDETLDLRKKSKTMIVNILNEKAYNTFGDDEYKYLVKMPMDSVSEENYTKLISDYDNRVEELEVIKSTSERNMWLNDLKALDKFIQ
uniref:DNA topoisomerase (ATP-hydrolyzing) n=1 Tax=viral metagenome TaxID=1070528 RepID=A0A6C0JDQ4_9ZZZZ